MSRLTDEASPAHHLALLVEQELAEVPLDIAVEETTLLSLEPVGTQQGAKQKKADPVSNPTEWAAAEDSRLHDRGRAGEP